MSTLNLTFSQHYESTKMKVRCHQTPYDLMGKTIAKRPKAQSNIYEIRVICENCVQQDPTNSFIQISVGDVGDAGSQTFFVHFFEWQFNSIWSSEVDEEENCEGCSIIKGFTVPDQKFGVSSNFQESFKGQDPTIIHILLTPTYYQNPVDEVDLAGYRVHLQNIDKGSTINAREAVSMDQNTMKQIFGNPDIADEFSIKFQMSLSSNIYQIRVIQLKNILEAIAEVMGFLAGFSFIARFSKHILVSNRVGYRYDKIIEDHQAKIQQLKRDQINAISNSVASSPKKASDQNQLKKLPSQREVSTSPMKLRPKAASDYDASMQFGSSMEEVKKQQQESTFRKKSKFVLSPVHNAATDQGIPNLNKGSQQDEEVEDDFQYFYKGLQK